MSQNQQSEMEFIMTRSFRKGTSKSGKMETDTAFIPADQVEALLAMVQKAAEEGGENGIALVAYHGISQAGRPYTKYNVRGLTAGRQQPQQSRPAVTIGSPQAGKPAGQNRFATNKRPFNPAR